MSELRVGYIAQSTEEVLHRVQSTLQAFVERPEKYNFSSYDADRHLVACGGVGSIALNYTGRNTAHVRFASEEDFDVTAGYRLHTGIYVTALALHEINALKVQYPHDAGPIYLPKRWPDGGYSLVDTHGNNLDVDVVWQIEQVVGKLSTAFSQSTEPSLSIIREA